MFRDALRLFRSHTNDRVLRRQRRGTCSFLVLWLLCLIVSLHTHHFILSVENLVVLNNGISLAAAVIARAMAKDVSLCSSDTTYPYCFGLHRVSVVLRFGSAVFFSFGCLTTILEGLHHVLHRRPADPLLPFVFACAHCALLLWYRQDVLLTDRLAGRWSPMGASVTGGGGYAEAQLFFAACGDAQKDAQGPSAGLGGGLMRRSLGSTRDLFVLLAMPMTTLACCVWMAMTYSTRADTVVALGAACVYLYVGYVRGREMLWLLLNNAITDPALCAATKRALRSIKIIEGVLQVQSSVFWSVNAGQAMGMVRVRLMSDADAAHVTLAARRELQEVVAFAYVECFRSGSTAGGDFSEVQLHKDQHSDHAHGHDHCNGHDHEHSHHGHLHQHHHHHHHHAEDGQAQNGGGVVTSSSYPPVSNPAMHLLPSLSSPTPPTMPNINLGAAGGAHPAFSGNANNPYTPQPYQQSSSLGTASFPAPPGAYTQSLTANYQQQRAFPSAPSASGLVPSSTYSYYSTTGASLSQPLPHSTARMFPPLPGTH